MSSTLHALENWDGKSTADLQEIYNKLNSQSLAFELVPILPHHPVAVTWLIKHATEQGTQLTGEDWVALIEHLLQTQHWQSMLHILQISAHLTIPNKYVKPLYANLRHKLSHTNKLIRAWSYQALSNLTKQYPEYEKEVVELLNMALNDEVSSVKARIRIVLRSQQSLLFNKNLP